MTSRIGPSRASAAHLAPAGRRKRVGVRLALLSIAVVALIGAMLQPAAAASKPGKVGLVSFTGKSFVRSSNTASLTFSWPKASRAKKYEIFLSRSYSMTKAKKFTTSSRSKTIKKLKPGRDYFVQVRAVNGSKRGTKSNRVGHTTIRRMDIARGPSYRVMTYNVCSRVCSQWPTRQPFAHQRITSYSPDIVAAQEADNLVPPAGYSVAHYKSGKRLLYKASRFTRLPGTPEAQVMESVDTGERCSPSRTWGSYGEILLGHHDGGCRYAVWSKLDDRTSSARTLFVNVHTVSGDNSTRARERQAEIQTLSATIAAVNPEGLRVVYAGDFNTHKNRSNDYVAREFNSRGYFDAYDLAAELRLQHNNSYNDFKTTPKISYKWGDHVDKVWIRPDQGRVLRWSNGALIKNAKMVAPIPSDHSPLIIDMKMN